MDPHWKLGYPFHKDSRFDRDYNNRGYRKYREYGKFTKKFDKKKKENM